MKRDKKIFLELRRKIFHIISISFLIFPLEIFGKESIVFLLSLMLIIFFPIVYFNIRNKLTYPFWNLLKTVERDENWKIFPARQAFSLAVGLILVGIFFNEEILKISILTTAIYDGVATIVGKLFGKHKIPFTKKSIEGTLGGIFANTFVLSFFISPFQSLIISIFAAIVEIFANSKKWYLDDNFLLPVLVAIFSALFVI
ncbi:MAG: hypothetical protein GXO21_05570 [Aquificae bacterium]|nr:hypothetical protein [Aquificota bacterium]